MEYVIGVIALLVLWIFRSAIKIWTGTTEEMSKSKALKVNLQIRKDEDEIVNEAKELLASGYEGLSKDMEAFIMHGRPMPRTEGES